MPSAKQRPSLDDIQDVQARDLPDDRPTQFLDTDPVWPMTVMPDAKTRARAREALRPPPVRAGWRFMFTHPAHALALGFGTGLSPRAPGTVGTLLGWAAFVALNPWLSGLAWAVVLLAAFAVGWWACTRTAQHLGVGDPSAVVWDEVLGIWLALWLLTPGVLWGAAEPWALSVLALQTGAFGVFRYFDIAKPGPVGWADRVFKARRWRPRRGLVGWAQGMGIILDDLLAGLLTVAVIGLLLLCMHALGLLPAVWI